MHIIWLIIEVLNSLIEVIITFAFLNAFLDTKETISKKYIFLSFSVMFVIQAIASILIKISMPHIIIAFSLTLLLIICVYKGNLFKKCFTAVLLIVFIVVSEVAVFTFFSLFYGETVTTVFNNGMGRLVGMLLCKFVMFWIVMFSITFLRKKIEHIPIKYWVLFCLMPIITLVILANIKLYVEAQAGGNISVIFAVLGLLYINFSIFEFFRHFSAEIKLNVLEELMQREHDNYKILEASQKASMILKHDIENHIKAIERMVRNNDFVTVESHLADLKKITQKINAITYTGNSAVDTILNTKGQQAQALEILYTVNARINAPIKIKPIDVCVILGNAIDNAIEACCRISDSAIHKYIHINIDQNTDELMIVFENSFDKVKKNSAGDLITIKPNSRQHGFGIESIKQAVSGYDGRILLKHDNMHFILTVLI